ncbi:calcium-binding protein [Croceibacterium ferulae]|uniref:calcium-binding protein n=1 Tax=Croceibacterium ferulae TaxID=1854641 RepID=UPI00138FD108|nr:hypothetical protein [Croceibacterium ferulae]
MARKKSVISNFIATADGQSIVGTAGDDIMDSTFNHTTLVGGDGADTISTSLTGRAEDDGLYAFQNGGVGRDTLTFTLRGRAYYAGVVQEGGGGDDTITSSIGLAMYDYSNPHFDYVEAYGMGGGGNDVIRMSASVGGGTVVQEAYGGVGTDDISLTGYAYIGTVTLYAEGGAGDDRIEAVADGTWRTDTTVELYGGDGNDTLIVSVLDGNVLGVDLYGGEGDDILSNENMAFSGHLYGDDGNDVLKSGWNTDWLEGGAGADLFHVRASDWDIIVDFDLAEGDRLVLSAGTSVTGMTQSGGNTVLVLNSGQLQLLGVTDLDLSQAFA